MANGRRWLCTVVVIVTVVSGVAPPHPGEPRCRTSCPSKKAQLGKTLAAQHPSPPAPQLSPIPTSTASQGPSRWGQTRLPASEDWAHRCPLPVLVLAAVLCLLSGSCPLPTTLACWTCLGLLGAAVELRENARSFSGLPWEGCSSDVTHSPFQCVSLSSLPTLLNRVQAIFHLSDLC